MSAGHLQAVVNTLVDFTLVSMSKVKQSQKHCRQCLDYTKKIFLRLPEGVGCETVGIELLCVVCVCFGVVVLVDGT